MKIKKLLFTCLLTIFLIKFDNLLAQDSSIIPLKKPNLSSEQIQEKISKNILKPLKKPKKTKDIKIIEKKIIEIDKDTKLSFKIPKKKPSIAGVTTSISVKISKYYNKKDFSIARKAIAEMEKGRWTSSLKIAKKAKDKSIYNFVQWRHLLTTGNKASFYDYKVL